MSIQTDRITKVSGEIRDLLIAKNQDYGNSAGMAPLLLPELSPTEAILVRMSDKINRIIQGRAGKTELKIKDEKFEDTIKDLAGYCILLLINLREENGIPSTNDCS